MKYFDVRYLGITPPFSWTPTRTKSTQAIEENQRVDKYYSNFFAKLKNLESVYFKLPLLNNLNGKVGSNYHGPKPSDVIAKINVKKIQENHPHVRFRWYIMCHRDKLSPGDMRYEGEFSKEGKFDIKGILRYDLRAFEYEKFKGNFVGGEFEGIGKYYRILYYFVSFLAKPLLIIFLQNYHFCHFLVILSMQFSFFLW